MSLGEMARGRIKPELEPELELELEHCLIVFGFASGS
jgi:hypothetical protein